MSFQESPNHHGNGTGQATGASRPIESRCGAPGCLDPQLRSPNSGESLSFIRLRGAPYEQTVAGKGINPTDTLDRLAESTHYRERLELALTQRVDELAPLFTLGFHGFDKLLKSPRHLSYEQAYAAGAFICCASNRTLHELIGSRIPGADKGLAEPSQLKLHAISILQVLSTREALIGFHPAELAGLIAVVLELDTVTRVASPQGQPVFAFGGMGGDRGLRLQGTNRKPFSISTLGALALSSFGLVHKHHSYPNTSRIAGQSAIEALGARSDFESAGALEEVLQQSSLLMSSCHNTRTIHTISHLLKGETINHAIGPGAIPQSSATVLNALVGVNHNVHPATFMAALKILNERGVQAYGPSVGFCGIPTTKSEIPRVVLDPERFAADPGLRELVALDEVAPPPHTTLASFLTKSGVISVLIEPADFMPASVLHEFAPENLYIENTEEAILSANDAALKGADKDKVDYLAMTVALGLFCRQYADSEEAFHQHGSEVSINRALLQDCFLKARQSLASGDAKRQLESYVRATQQSCGGLPPSSPSAPGVH
jgi:anthranilate phosphoribosyltransferase